MEKTRILYNTHWVYGLDQYVNGIVCVTFRKCVRDIVITSSPVVSSGGAEETSRPVCWSSCLSSAVFVGSGEAELALSLVLAV